MKKMLFGIIIVLSIALSGCSNHHEDLYVVSDKSYIEECTINKVVMEGTTIKSFNVYIENSEGEIHTINKRSLYNKFENREGEKVICVFHKYKYRDNTYEIVLADVLDCESLNKESLS